MQGLREIPLFGELTEEEMGFIAQNAIVKHFPRHAIIINEGDQTDSLYVIIDGQVRIFLDDENGREVTLNSQGPGEFLGELSLLDDAPRSASVMASQPCQFVIITKPSFEQCLVEHPAIAFKLLKSLARRIRQLSDDIKDLALLDVHGRVARVLEKSAVQTNGKLVVQKLTHQEIANRVGSSREMVSRVMKDLVKKGFITHRDNEIIIRRAPGSPDVV